MNNEKYKADIDETLKAIFKKEASGLQSVNVIAFSEELVLSHAIRKMAFDVYRVENDPYKSLWLLEDVGGKPHLVRSSDPTFASNKSGDWSAISDYENKNITLAYKNIPIARFSSESYGFAPEDIGSFKTALLELAGEDQAFVKDVFAEQPEEKRKALASTFPELTKFI